MIKYKECVVHKVGDTYRYCDTEWKEIIDGEFIAERKEFIISQRHTYNHNNIRMVLTEKKNKLFNL